MDQSTFKSKASELERIRAELRTSGAADVLQRVQGLHRMARLVEFNAEAAIEHLGALDDPGTALPLLSTSADAQAEWQRYANRAELLLHDYLLSAIGLVEHARVHVRSAYPADSPTRVPNSPAGPTSRTSPLARSYRTCWTRH